MAKKIILEFELNGKDVKRLIKSGPKGKTLSDKEVDKLTKKGVIRASDYLDKRQLRSVASAAVLPEVYNAANEGVNKSMPQLEDKFERKGYEKSAEKAVSPTQKKQSGSVESSRKDFPKK